MTSARNPYLLSLLSFAVRTTVILFCFYLLLQSGWYNLFAALFGFLLARTVITFKLNPAGRKKQAL
jgi:F1F0 ATPase subunit 2